MTIAPNEQSAETPLSDTQLDHICSSVLDVTNWTQFFVRSIIQAFGQAKAANALGRANAGRADELAESRRVNLELRAAMLAENKAAREAEQQLAEAQKRIEHLAGDRDDGLSRYVTRLAYEALREQLAERDSILASIYQYGQDTLSGRVDGPDDRQWQRDTVLEMTKRAIANRAGKEPSDGR